MASYLGYFGNSSTSQPAFLNISSQSAGWIANIKKAITRESEEDDPDYEDCSHVSNVLRSYYSEKGHGRPEWLPPDPKKPYVTYQPPPQAGLVQYGVMPKPELRVTQASGLTGGGGRGAGGGGLSDLWDSSPGGNAGGQQSLRAPRTAQVGGSPGGGGLRPQDMLQPTSSYQQPGSSARPQHVERSLTSSPGISPGAGGMGGKDRLRARLQGGGASGRASPMASATDLNIPNPAPQRPGLVSHHSYDSRGTGVNSSSHFGGVGLSGQMPVSQSHGYGDELRRYPTGPR